MEAVILILGLLVVAFVALGIYVSVKVIGAASRGVDRTITQARRAVEDTTLRAKSYGQLGVVGELAQLRLSLRTSMRATQEALQTGVTEDASLSESLGLFQRLSVHGRELDDELKRLEREPDKTTVTSLLPGLRERTGQITRSAESLRWAARDRARQFADDDLAALNVQIDVEAGALRHWTTEEPAPGQQSDRPAERGQGPGQDRAGAPGPAQRQGPAQGHGNGPGDEGIAQAITAADPRQQTGYPWQKRARPETTN
ncbi:proline-rich domain-containing protein [Streptomyces laculatispora]|uniref:Proline-rich domain-containing protein n=1 Tax=Streptomyces laculatispora TaxID=887464 RepID=A0ABY9I8I6_9ACTN|nr:proline-rich domain-containing protein [Streptomyces laculatispora]WLQ43162.1 proline-rich domain-containing protein [Streptomyces laculatispora]